MRPLVLQQSRKRSCAADDELAGLLRLAADGDPGAFMRFYDATIRVVYGYARARYDDPPAAEDAVRSIYARAWGSVAGYPRSGLSAQAWLLCQDSRR